eukprot:scaffold1325_cov95-Cylindrotheca_fusiformis.AAC.2
MATESRKTRLEILRERQKKLRESYKTQIDISRKTLNDDDGEGTSAAAGAVPSESNNNNSSSSISILETKAGSIPAPLSVDTTRVPVSPSPTLAEAKTPNAALLAVQKENEKLKRQVVGLQADRELLLQKQMERFASASEQLNEMEELLEDYRNIAEESEENNAVLRAQVSLMTTEKESLKTENDQLKAQVQKQNERLDSSVQAMNDMEEDLMKTQDELDLADQHVRTLEIQMRNMATAAAAAQRAPAPPFHGGHHHHGGTTFYPPPPPPHQGTTFYPLPQAAAGTPAPGAAAGPTAAALNFASTGPLRQAPPFIPSNPQPYRNDQGHGGGGGGGSDQRWNNFSSNNSNGSNSRGQNNKKKRR